MTPDVAVVGGGIIGTATAAFLAEAGARVTLYESTDIAAGASGRNSGVIQQPFDSALVGLYRRSLEEYRGLAAAVPSAFALGAEPSGLLYVGPESAADEAARLVAAWADAYPETAPELVPGPALRALEPGLAEGLAACRLGIGFPVAPAAATFAFALLARQRGARIARGGALLRVDRDRATGVLNGGRFEPAGAVVVAAGPWTQPVIGDGAWPPIGRSWGAVASLALEGPPRHVLEEIDIDIEPDDAVEGQATAADTDVGFGFSLVTAAGQSALGSTFLPDRPDQAAVLPALRERGARYVPAIATAPLAAMRSCARPVTPDGRPLIGPVPGIAGAFVAAGHGPWGISTGPGSARLIADVVLGRTAVADVPGALDAARFGAPQRTPVPG
ncbi:MAG TPA: FAD-dependent oxidoreductase [Candidatus Limnocylindrales bacterium]|nr:FAD-dependent oxidoreductase [Candidatus Limnocylindrales bacterium]